MNRQLKIAQRKKSVQLSCSVDLRLNISHKEKIS